MQKLDANIRALLEKCNALLKDNKVDDALTISKNFLTTHPKAALAWNMQGIIYCDYLFEFEKAITAFERALELDKANSSMYLDNLGICYNHLYKYDKAIESYQASLQYDIKNPSPYVSLAYLYRDKGDKKKSKEVLNNALQLLNKEIKAKPTAEMLNKRGMIYCDLLEQYDNAIADFTEAIQLKEGNSHQYLFNIGNCYLGKDDYDNAVKYYTQAIEVTSKINKSYYYNRSIAYYHQNNIQATINDLEIIHAEYPKDEEILLYLSELYGETKDYNNVLLVLNKALDLNPGNPAALNSRGSLLVDKIGKYEAAIKDFSKAIELDKENSYLYYFNRGNAFSKLGDYNSAVYNYLESLAMNPSFTEPLLNLGLSYFYMAEYEEALIYFDKDLITSPNDFNALTFRARCYLALGKANRAWADINRMKQIDSHAPSLFLILAEYYSCINKEAEFLKNFELALEKKANIAEIASSDTILEKYKSNKAFHALLKKYNITTL